MCSVFSLQPFKRREQYYEPLLHTTSAFGHLPYGNKYFREEFPMKFISQKVFFLSFYMLTLHMSLSVFCMDNFSQCLSHFVSFICYSLKMHLIRSSTMYRILCCYVVNVFVYEMIIVSALQIACSPDSHL